MDNATNIDCLNDAFGVHLAQISQQDIMITICGHQAPGQEMTTVLPSMKVVECHLRMPVN